MGQRGNIQERIFLESIFASNRYRRRDSLLLILRGLRLKTGHSPKTGDAASANFLGPVNRVLANVGDINLRLPFLSFWQVVIRPMRNGAHFSVRPFIEGKDRGDTPSKFPVRQSVRLPGPGSIPESMVF